MKFKYGKFSAEITDNDSKNIMDFIKYFMSLSDKDQIKLLTLFVCIPYAFGKLTMECYKTYREEKRKDAELECGREMELTTLSLK